MKSRPVTPDPTSTVGEKSKELADKALNLINPARKFEQRRRNLRLAIAWWEDEDQNPDLDHVDYSRRKIIFADRKNHFRRRRASLESSIRYGSEMGCYHRKQSHY